MRATFGDCGRSHSNNLAKEKAYGQGFQISIWGLIWRRKLVLASLTFAKDTQRLTHFPTERIEGSALSPPPECNPQMYLSLSPRPLP